MRFHKITLLTAIAALLLLLLSVPCLTAQAVQSSSTISGQVVDTSGNSMAGVTIVLIGDRTGTQIAQTDASGNYALRYGANNRITVMASKSGYIFSPLSTAFISNVTLTGNWEVSFTGFNAATFPITILQTPVLLTEENSLRALALESISLRRDPFPVLTLHNFSSDNRTRIVLFAVNAELKPAENISSITAQAEDSLHQPYNLPVESIGKVPGHDWLKQVVVRLPDGLGSAGDIWVSIRVHDVVSNKVLVKVMP
jgi:hypothetical protein